MPSVSQKLCIEVESKAARYLKVNPEVILENINGRIEAVKDDNRVFIAESPYIFNIHSWRIKGNILEI
jgi:hypothetical protein